MVADTPRSSHFQEAYTGLRVLQAISERFPRRLTETLNVKEQPEGPLRERLQKITEDEGAAMLAFIAPYTAVRVSPSERVSPFISLPEEFGIEYALSALSKYNIDKLFLLMNSPGGDPSSSYVIARSLRTHFKYLKVFVPHIAASGATLITLGGNDIVMGPISRLSPIDVQVPYKGSYVSTNAMERSLSRLTDYFKDKMPEEAPYPWKLLADRLDPVLIEHWSSYMVAVAQYTTELLTLSGYKASEIENILNSLVFTEHSHDFVIHRDMASKIGLKVSEDPKDLEYLDVMREWLSEYMFEQQALHCIRYVTPLKEDSDDN